jgi:hypothetical protein
MSDEKKSGRQLKGGGSAPTKVPAWKARAIEALGGRDPSASNLHASQPPPVNSTRFTIDGFCSKFGKPFFYEGELSEGRFKITGARKEPTAVDSRPATPNSSAGASRQEMPSFSNIVGTAACPHCGFSHEVGFYDFASPSSPAVRHCRGQTSNGQMKTSTGRLITEEDLRPITTWPPKLDVKSVEDTRAAAPRIGGARIEREPRGLLPSARPSLPAAKPSLPAPKR